MGCFNFQRLCDPEHGAPYLANEPKPVRRAQHGPQKSNSSARVSVPSTYKEDFTRTPSSKGSWTGSERSSPALSNNSPPTAQRQWQSQQSQYQPRGNKCLDLRDSRNHTVSPMQSTATLASQRTGQLPQNHPARVSMDSTSRTNMHPNYPSTAYPSYTYQPPRPVPTATSKWQTARQPSTSGAQLMPLAQIQRSMSPLSAISTDGHETGAFAPSIRSMGSRDTLSSSPPAGHRHAPYGLSPVNELPGSMPRFTPPKSEIPLAELPGDVPVCKPVCKDEMEPVELADTDTGIARGRA